MSLRAFVEATERRPAKLALVNWDAPRPLRNMLEGTIERQPIEVLEEERPGEDANVVYLLRDGEVIASSPLAALEESILLVNSDTYRTGSGGIDVQMPAVLDALADTRFTLRGYPESHKEKLVLILVSRHIESLALNADGGRLRTGFQDISRIHDEHGTHSVYRQLAASDVDAHVYGVPDWTPPPTLELTMHGGWEGDFRDSWFVVHVPADDDRDGRQGDAVDPDAPDTAPTHAALVAIEDAPRRWEGFWTYDTEQVRAINRSIERRL